MNLFCHQVHQERAGQDLPALQALLDLAAPPDVQDTPESAGLLDLLDTVTPLSVLVFLTTGKDTEVRMETCSGCISRLSGNEYKMTSCYFINVGKDQLVGILVWDEILHIESLKENSHFERYLLSVPLSQMRE